jgi:hypothetical protein
MIETTLLAPARTPVIAATRIRIAVTQTTVAIAPPPYNVIASTPTGDGYPPRRYGYGLPCAGAGMRYASFFGVAFISVAFTFSEMTTNGIGHLLKRSD